MQGFLDKEAILWDAVSGKRRQKFGHERDIHVAVLIGDGKFVAIGAADNSAVVWNADSGAKIQTFNHGHFVGSLALSRDGKRLVTGSYAKNKTAYLWDVETRKVLQTFVGYSDGLPHLAFSSESKVVLIAGFHSRKTADMRKATFHEVALCDADTGKKLHTFASNSQVMGLSGEGNRVATISSGSSTVTVLPIHARVAVGTSWLPCNDGRCGPLRFASILG